MSATSAGRLRCTSDDIGQRSRGFIRQIHTFNGTLARFGNQRGRFCRFRTTRPPDYGLRLPPPQNHGPCWPARAASIAAFNANRLVCGNFINGFDDVGDISAGTVNFPHSHHQIIHQLAAIFADCSASNDN